MDAAGLMAMPATALDAPRTDSNPAAATGRVDASVVICAYTVGRWSALQRAVASVIAQRQPPTEIIVVVDHNAELFQRALRRWPPGGARATGQVRVVESVGMQGLSGARNTGVQTARAATVIFLDDDAEAEREWSERLVAPFADPAILATGGAAVPRLIGARPPWWPLEFDWVLGCSYVGLPTRRADVRNMIGANMAVRRAALTELNGFAEGIGRVGDLPFGCEETDLCIRLAQRWPAARIVYEPAARVLHSVPTERMTWRYFRARCFAEGVSKASVAARVGGASALASERSYTLRVLPRGAARGVIGACRGDWAAGRRAAAITAGLAITTGGYVRGRLAKFSAPQTEPA